MGLVFAARHSRHPRRRRPGLHPLTHSCFRRLLLDACIYIREVSQAQLPKPDLTTLTTLHLANSRRRNNGMPRARPSTASSSGGGQTLPQHEGLDRSRALQDVRSQVPTGVRTPSRNCFSTFLQSCYMDLAWQAPLPYIYFLFSFFSSPPRSRRRGRPKAGRAGRERGGEEKKEKRKYI